MDVYKFSYPDDTVITVGVIAGFFGVIAIILAVVIVIQVTIILT